jgi:NADPH:quinone reductase-like Zn-dependent oxidoreductase
MKAIVRETYGSPDVLELRDVAIPVPGDGSVLIRVRAASVNALDWHLLRAEPSLVRMMAGLRKPRTQGMGADAAGVVEAVGKNVSRLRPGDEVFGTGDGAFAEYLVADEKKLALKPANVTFEQAAALPVAGISALQALRDKGRVQPGQEVLINGAAGGVGTFAVQIARAFGASVTGVCSTRNVEMVRALGATRVIDYTQEDFTRGKVRYDVILDIADNHSLAEYRRVLTRNGILVTLGAAGGPGEQPGTGRIFLGMLQTILLSAVVSQKLALFLAKVTAEDLDALRELVEAGKVTPVIDREYPLAEVPDAIRHVETGHARGKVVIRI